MDKKDLEHTLEIYTHNGLTDQVWASNQVARLLSKKPSPMTPDEKAVDLLLNISQWKSNGGLAASVQSFSTEESNRIKEQIPQTVKSAVQFSSMHSVSGDGIKFTLRDGKLLKLAEKLGVEIPPNAIIQVEAKSNIGR
jgi:hypothetical protein